MIVVEKNVPLVSSGAHGELRATLRSMRVGESFLVGDRPETSIRTSAASLGVKVSIRDDHKGMRRCWKTA